jgi:hypothetical protein
LEPETKKKALEESNLCMFCLRHSAGSECYERGSDSKPACQTPECEEKHLEKLHEMLAGLDANVNLVAEEEDEEEEDGYVNMARADKWEEKEYIWCNPDHSWLEMEAEEEIEDEICYVNTLTRGEGR